MARHAEGSQSGPGPRPWRPAVTRLALAIPLLFAGGLRADDARHWAFRPPRSSAPPAVRDTAWPRGDVDRFLLAAIEARGLAPVADADRATLLRRVCLDLTGLPPTPGEVAAFLADDSPGAFERVVDRLLASPAYGERMGRHWLDLARYAESTGKTVNFAYPQAWRYRDWVIDAFAADMPWDAFIRAQLAGDLLPADTPARAAAGTIATGFLALGAKALNERDGLKYELDIADEQIDVTTQAFLGLTVACARCHDHKVDPFSQADYAALAGIFRSTETCYGTVPFINAQRPTALIPLPAGADLPAGTAPLGPEERARVEARIRTTRDSMRGLRDPLQQFFTAGTLSLLRARLDAFEEDGSPKTLAMGVRDKRPGPEPARRRARGAGPGGFTHDGTTTIGDSPVYDRGEAATPRDGTVPRGALAALECGALAIPEGTSGRRELAEWIASPENPLAARVIVDRAWAWLFGRGLVPTPDDFGTGGRPPDHPQLLDTLACRFVAEGSSVKRLLRELVTSHAYALAATAEPAALDADPDDVLCWRAAPRRLDADTLRDAVLAVSGRLDPARPAGSPVATAGEGPVSQPRRGGDGIGRALADPGNVHRSVYLPAIRDLPHPFLGTFDGADPTLVTVRRQQTTVPTQGLLFLNDPFVLLAADAAAERVLAEAESPSDADRTAAAVLRILARPATDDDRARGAAFLAAWRAGAGAEATERGTWSAFCQVLLASPEFHLRP